VRFCCCFACRFDAAALLSYAAKNDSLLSQPCCLTGSAP
jgi:hypothetical protein